MSGCDEITDFFITMEAKSELQRYHNSIDKIQWPAMKCMTGGMYQLLLQGVFSTVPPYFQNQNETN